MTSNFGIPLSQSSRLLHIAAAPSVLFLGVGTAGILNPNFALSLFRITPLQPEAQKLARNLMLIWASRDALLSASILAGWYTGSGKTMGYIYVASCAFAISDAVVQWRQTGNNVMAHAGFVPLGLGLGGALLGWFDGLLK